MNEFVIAALALGVGLVVGSVYGFEFGRKVEQKIVGKAIAEFDAACRIPQSVLNLLHQRLSYLKKYIGEKI
jgi:hypothetical protein